VNLSESGARLARHLVLGLAALVASCGQTSSRDKDQHTTNEAGQPSNGAGTSGSAGSGGAQSGGVSGLMLGGSIAVDPEAGATSVGGKGYVGVPLVDTMLCDNVFMRVAQLPDAAPVFSGTFDGEPVDVFGSADVAEPPVFAVFRFGPTHVEAINLSLYLPVGPYDVNLVIGACGCGKSGELFLRSEPGLRHYELSSAELQSVTSSVDGFSGLTRGSVAATWLNDDGEEHVLRADFTLNAVMGDARTQL